MLPLLAAVWLAPVQPASASTTTFGFSGGEQTYTVPADVHAIHVVAVGARGGKGSDEGLNMGGPGGLGGRVEADLSVAPGQVLFVEVGGGGSDGGGRSGGGVGGFNGGGSSNDGAFQIPGGGGGGATDIRTCSRLALSCAQGGDTLSSRLLVAGGGGGGGSVGRAQLTSGGDGGNASEDGVAGQSLECGQSTPGGGGGAGTQTAGGVGGVAGSGEAPAGSSGTLGLGGAAGVGGLNNEPGGGGGGGYFGGGAGGSGNGCPAGGGGGGSSFAATIASGVSLTTDRTGSAAVVISSTLKPSNAFRLGRLSRDKRKGTGTLTVELPGPGVLSLAGQGLVPRHRSVAAPMTARLPVKPRGRSMRLLSRTGQAKVTAKVTFVPSGGEPSTQSRTLKLIRRV
jgi:Glycine rich protein